jgi:hypothetical protein
MNSLPETDSPMYNFNHSLCDMMDLDELLPCERQELEMELQDAREERMRASRGSAKQVSFDEYVEFELIEPISELTEEEKHDCWYRRCELDDFKQQAKKLCKTKCKGQESTRGLECYFPQRMRGFQRTNDQVLRAYMFSGDSEQVGQIAEQCNAEARHLALATGVQDFYEAYFPQIMQQSPRDAFEPTPLRQPASVGPSMLARRF